jgi:hypothetical protein
MRKFIPGKDGGKASFHVVMNNHQRFNVAQLSCMGYILRNREHNESSFTAASPGEKPCGSSSSGFISISLIHFWSGWLVIERSRDAKDPRSVKGNFGEPHFRLLAEVGLTGRV